MHAEFWWGHGRLEDWAMRDLYEANLREICCEDGGGWNWESCHLTSFGIIPVETWVLLINLVLLV
jgi:hypothetical protein